MNTFLKALGLTLALGASYAIATPGGEGNNTNCNGQGNPNSPCEPSNGNGGSGGAGGNGGSGGSGGNGGDSSAIQGQAQGQVSNNDNTNTNTSGASADSASSSDSNSNSSSSSGGNTLSNTVGIETGGATSGSNSSASGGAGYGGNASASTGDSNATVGDTSSSSGGNTQVLDADYQDGDVEVEVADGDNSQSTTFEQNYEASASSAATVFAGWCQSGASGQISGGGFSVVNPEAFCNHVRMAAVALEAYEYEMSKCQCVGICTSKVASVAQECTFETDEADMYLAMYHDNLADANGLLQATTTVGKVDAFAGYLVRPLALLALLLLL
jgi:hypothetical protein